MRGQVIVAALLGVFGLGGTASEAQPEYEFVWLETGDLVASGAESVSSSGLIAGGGVDQAGFGRAVLWSDAGMQVLPTPDGFDNVSLRMANIHGAAIGNLANVDWGVAGGIWDGSAWSVYMPTQGFVSSWLVHISDSGIAVGGMAGADETVPIQIVGGQLQQLPTLTDWSGVRAERVLADGTIMGTRSDQGSIRPVRWVEGIPEDVTLPMDSYSYRVSAFGPTGQMGIIDTANPGGIWLGDGSEWQWIGGLSGSTYAQSINASGDVLFSLYDTEQLLWQGGELHNLLESFELPDGARDARGYSFNDAGRIAGTFHANGRPYAMVLNPVPSPATMALLGLGGLFAWRRKRRVMFAAVVLTPVTALGSPPPRYFVDVIGPYVGGQQTYLALDDTGRVAGRAQGNPVVWQDGEMTVLMTPDGYLSSYAVDITVNGVLGYAKDADYDPHPVVWVHGDPVFLDGFDGFSAYPTAISSTGHVIGSFDQPGGTGAFRWHQGDAVDLGNLGQQYTRARDVNQYGHVVGRSRTRGRVTHGFVWMDGIMTDLGILEGLAHSSARSINSDGLIVGECYTYNWEQATPFVWEHGAMVQIPILGDRGIVLALNDAGTIVGECWAGTGPAMGTVWIEREPYRLDDLLVTDEPWEIEIGLGINNPGQILARGELDGVEFGVILTPACPADFNLDRVTDTRDVVAFLGAWAAGDSGADFDGNGTVDSRDVTVFLSAWASGCG